MYGKEAVPNQNLVYSMCKRATREREQVPALIHRYKKSFSSSLHLIISPFSLSNLTKSRIHLMTFLTSASGGHFHSTPLTINSTIARLWLIGNGILFAYPTWISCSFRCWCFFCRRHFAAAGLFVLFEK
mgnify:CR=1 FL=1